MYKLTKSEAAEAVTIYVNAFLNDPLFDYLLPNKKTRSKAMRLFFKSMVRYSIKYNEIYGVGRPLKGLAIWVSPGQKESLYGYMRFGFLKLLYTSFMKRIWGAMKIGVVTQRYHKKHCPTAHFYLNILSVDPNHHGEGISSILVKPIIEKAEKMHLKVYLETTNPKNLSIYQHFGFSIVEEYHIPKSKLIIWSLLKK